MIDSLIVASRAVFAYPRSLEPRRHGPRGYVDYQAYKPWLRDEFAYRCVYCLTRERWKPDGHAGFSVEHVRPQSSHPELTTEYDNLVYTCCACNSFRQSVPLPIDPSQQPLGRHLQVLSGGRIEPLTDDGVDFIAVCQLNRPTLLWYRGRMQRTLEYLTSRLDEAAIRLLTDLLGYPSDLPNLALRRPPRGNSRAAGVETCCFARQQRNELTTVY